MEVVGGVLEQRRSRRLMGVARQGIPAEQPMTGLGVPGVAPGPGPGPGPLASRQGPVDGDGLVGGGGFCGALEPRREAAGRKPERLVFFLCVSS